MHFLSLSVEGSNYFVNLCCWGSHFINHYVRI